MPRNAILSKGSLENIAERLGPFLAIKDARSGKGRWEAEFGKSIPTLGAVFQIWVLGFNTMQLLRNPVALALRDYRLSELAENSRYWHLEIQRDGRKAVGFAEAFQTTAGGTRHWRVHRMGLLPIAAGEVQRALTQLQRLSGNPLRALKVRILRAPGLDLGLLWLEERRLDKILVFHKPSGTRGLSTKRLYEWPEFVRVVSTRRANLSLNGPKLRPDPSTNNEGPPQSGNKRRKARSRYPIAVTLDSIHKGQFDDELVGAGTTPFAVIGADCTIPTTPLTLNPLAPGWEMVSQLTWNATIAYTGHGRTDTVSFSGMSDVWSPVLINFQGNVQGGTITLQISAPVVDTGSGVHKTIPWTGTSLIIGTYPISHNTVRARLASDALNAIAYMETLAGQRFQQFLPDGTPCFGAPNGFGVMQLDPPDNARQIWDWEQNVDAGKARFQTALNVANNYFARAIAAHPGLPQPSNDQILCSAMTYYNGGGANGFHYIPNSAGNDWVRNPNATGNAAFAQALNYGDNGIALLHQVQSGSPPTDW
jgi:hypothetical protein